jgi:hypothetical protein
MLNYTVTPSINSVPENYDSNKYTRWYLDVPATAGAYTSNTGSGVSAWGLVFVSGSTTGGAPTSGTLTATGKFALSALKYVSMQRIEASGEIRLPLDNS